MTKLLSLRSNSLLGRLARWPLRLIPKDLAMPVVRGPLAGKRWIVGALNHGCWLGSYERSRQQAFVRYLRPGHVVYDIGAHTGFYTLLAAHLVGPTGQVLAFEPLDRNLRLLQQHLKLNRVGNVDLFRGAVWSREGVVRFTLAESSGMGRVSGEGQMEVRSFVLDTLVYQSEFPAPNLMKIDVEGGECEVLNGATRILREQHPIIILSTHSQQLRDECQRILREAAYVVEPEDGDDACLELIALPVGVPR